MNDIFTALGALPDEPQPKKLAQKTMNKLLILKLRPYLYALSASLCVNFFWLAIKIYEYLVNSAAWEVIRVMIEDFDLSSDYLLNSLAGLREVLPLNRLLLLGLNLLLLLFLSVIFRHYRAELLKFGKKSIANS